ncbi:MAG: methyltransferase domain-containing protein [Bacteroidales bacterium]|nr:methyltransferase domain-containing protein [Bacteroidales bacterium]
MKSNIRIALEKKLIPTLETKVKGDVLEVGSGGHSYRKHMKFDSYKTLDINPDLDVDYNEDIHNTKIESNTFDTILMIEVLEHLYNPFLAVKQVNRILKNSGVVIATVPFIHPYHGMPHDYFRYTRSGIREIFKDFSNVEIIEYGNLFGAVLDLLTSYWIFRFLKVLNPLNSLIFINRYAKKTPCGILVIAKNKS